MSSALLYFVILHMVGGIDFNEIRSMIGQR
jgi:hypothetical protein